MEISNRKLLIASFLKYHRSFLTYIFEALVTLPPHRPNGVPEIPAAYPSTALRPFRTRALLQSTSASPREGGGQEEKSAGQAAHNSPRKSKRNSAHIRDDFRDPGGGGFFFLSLCTYLASLLAFYVSRPKGLQCGAWSLRETERAKKVILIIVFFLAFPNFL